MYIVYILTLIILLLILIILFLEERRFEKNLTHGLVRKYWILAEKRRFVRFKKDLNIRYQPVKKAQDFKDSKASNISKSGLCLITHEKLKRKDLLNLEIELQDIAKVLKVTCQVVCVKELHDKDNNQRLFNTGVRFYKITPDAEALLLTYLYTLKDKR